MTEKAERIAPYTALVVQPEVTALKKALSNPRVWLYFACFPCFLIHYRRRRKTRSQA